MLEHEIVYRPIGIIHSDHQDPEKTPIQPVFAAGCKGEAEIFPPFVDGLEDLDGFSHIYLIYHLHRGQPMQLRVRPYLADVARGIFATRATCRPNPIGFSIVRLVSRQGAVLLLEDVDVLDRTPLLDIKPYIARFDCIQNCRSGWQEQVDETTARIRGKRGFAGTETDETE
ncbi:MAG TPA: tRNA (N6-threonylcarbamoyladenosine(37)-N6)-methyltransferase TrmO [bacterium]|nr:tRNA (N6-threonylcarbamoyladenosine(37)-N6)-methyltransferase TrmO [bacterium]